MLCLVATGSAAKASGSGTAPLQAAVARVDITPPAGLPMYGYMERTAGATGTLDPLYARVLLLASGKSRLAIVTLDLGRTFSLAGMQRLSALARSEGVAHLFVNASHTHSGPNVLDVYPARGPGAATGRWEAGAIGEIARAIAGARRREVACRLGVGRGRAFIGYNRRIVGPDGVRMLWSNPQRIPTWPVDPTVMVLRVDDAAGRPLAIVVNYACHAVVFGADNLQYSADWPGAMAATVERGMAEGGAGSGMASGRAALPRPMCLFMQGAAGDINPYDATTPVNAGAPAKRDATGREIGGAVLRVAVGIRTTGPDINAGGSLGEGRAGARGGKAPAARAITARAHDAIAFEEQILDVPVRWNPARFRDALLARYGARVFEDHAEALSSAPVSTLHMPLTLALLNGRIALVGISGEPFVEFQMNARARAPLSDLFFAGYTNGYFDYIPTIAAASQGGYGAADSNTYVEPGTGERMVSKALTMLDRMLGRLPDEPEK
jgi:neutral ceramidase